MPYGDGTGPGGMGPRTGRGAGGARGRAGGGGGWRNMFRATGLTGWQRAAGGPAADSAAEQTSSSVGQDLQMLKDSVKSLESALGEIRKRIEEIGAKSA